MGLFSSAELRRKEYEKHMEMLRIQNEQQLYKHQIEAAATQTKVERFNPNKHEAYQVPLSTLVTMWRLKYGDEWVDGSGEDDSAFYAHACVRLRAAGLFEDVRGWVRLKEDLA